MSDRKRFENFVYTKTEEAIKLLDKRDENEIEYDLPQEFYGQKKGVIFRQVATPNFEIMRFLTILPEALRPVIFEFHADKFTTQNEGKHLLGKLHFYKGFGKKGGMKVDTHKIIDFNTSDGKPLNKVMTTWGQPLIDFHKELFLTWNQDKHEVTFFDASAWFEEKRAKGYYEQFLKIFIKNGILFENFMLESKKEKVLIREVFLPAFIKVWITTGYKPLIVSLEPTEIEGEKFWSYYPGSSKVFLDGKINKDSQTS